MLQQLSQTAAICAPVAREIGYRPLVEPAAFHRRAAWWWGALIAVGLARSAAFTWSTGGEPWFNGMLAVDGPSYLHGMQNADNAGFLELKDLNHSPGYQLYLRGLYRLGGPRLVKRRIKWTAWILGACAAGLTALLGEALFPAGVGLAAAAALCWSMKWTAYINLIAYEIPLAFLLTALAAWLAIVLPRAGARRPWLALIGGLWATAAIFFHFRLLILLPPATSVVWTSVPGDVGRRSRAAATALFLLAPITLLGSWSIHQTIRTGELCVVQQLSPWSVQFRLHNNPQADGPAYPYHPMEEPSGLGFIIQRPGAYADLIMERFFYLWDFLKDVWYVGPDPGPFELAFHFAVCIAFFAGVVLRWRDDITAGYGGRFALYWILAAGMAGPLFAISTSRFLVPILPIVALFQVDALFRLARRLNAVKTSKIAHG